MFELIKSDDLKMITDTKKTGIILAIESSCDETAAAVCKDGTIVSNYIASQKVHQKWGGVVPELASRAHLQHIIPVVDAALKQAYTSLQQIDGIAFTYAPGLIGSLLVGAQFAKSLALVLNKPLLAIHHMQAHVLANLIDDPKPSFPFLCLTVSGGHTQIVLVRNANDLHVIGETRDDAAGEAFDKSAKLLGLPYPGGPLVDQYAKKGNPKAFHFPEPQIEDLDFSFSGIKTAVLYFLQQQREKDPAFTEKNLADICASIQHCIVSTLLNKLKRAALQTGIREVCLAGGVSANSGLRRAFEEMGQQMQWNTYVPAFEYCTDNAAMIAITGYYKYLNGTFAPLSVIAQARDEWH